MDIFYLWLASDLKGSGRVTCSPQVRSEFALSAQRVRFEFVASSLRVRSGFGACVPTLVERSAICTVSFIMDSDSEIVLLDLLFRRRKKQKHIRRIRDWHTWVYNMVSSALFAARSRRTRWALTANSLRVCSEITARSPRFARFQLAWKSPVWWDP